MLVTLFRHKCTREVIQAIQFDGSYASFMKIFEWTKGSFNKFEPATNKAELHLPDDICTASPSDWIVKYRGRFFVQTKDQISSLEFAGQADNSDPLFDRLKEVEIGAGHKIFSDNIPVGTVIKAGNAGNAVPYGSKVKGKVMDLFFKRMGQTGWFMMWACLLGVIIAAITRGCASTEEQKRAMEEDFKKQYATVCIPRGEDNAQIELLEKMYKDGWEFHDTGYNGAIILRRKR